MNFFTFLKRFPTERAIVDYYVKVRYGNETPHCNHCGSCKVYNYSSDKMIKFFRCGDCNRDFSIFKDTIFENSCTDLRKWFYAIHLFLNGKKGISALQLQREIEVTYKTAWRMLKQIRAAMGNKKKKDDDDDDDNGFMNTIIEIDETYLSGEAKNKHMSERVKAKGFFKKNIILGMLERGKEVRAFVIDKAKRDVIMEKIIENVAENSQIITDEHKAYYWVYTGWKHKVVNHSKGQFRNGKGVHTNSIEGFWSTLKRGVYGVYHHVSKKHLQGYVNEFAFRYNNRDNEFIFDKLVGATILN